MAKILELMPEVMGEEQLYVAHLLKNMDEDSAHQFANIYRTRRKDPQTILLLALVGFLGIAGVHRFIVDQIGLGILYFLTAGLCFIGTIVDLINYKKIAFEYNRQQADQIAQLIKSNL